MVNFQMPALFRHWNVEYVEISTGALIFPQIPCPTMAIQHQPHPHLCQHSDPRPLPPQNRQPLRRIWRNPAGEGPFFSLMCSGVDVHVMIRHGNCPLKCKFPQQWNWLRGEREKCPWGKETGGTTKKEEGSTSFSSALNSDKRHKVRSHTAITCLSRLIANTVTDCHSHRQT